ncbi:MAG: methyltransferase domain-containing protein [Paraperlucidibaca sp.]
MDALSRLLGATGATPHWGNLGAWRMDNGQLSAQQPYNEAAQRLAQLHASALDLAAGARLLELGSGSGASLRLWATYGVREVISMDKSATLLPADISDLNGFTHRAIHTSFDEPWPDLPLVDAVVSVDALYHARQLSEVLLKIAEQLTPQGRWAVTTLQLNADLSRRAQTILRTQLRACGIAWNGVWQASFAPADTTQQIGIFQQAGLRVSRVDDLSESVLMGFATAIEYREKQLSRIDRLHPAWWKLSLTARLCRSLVASGKVRYVLIVGDKSSVDS